MAAVDSILNCCLENFTISKPDFLFDCSFCKLSSKRMAGSEAKFERQLQTCLSTVRQWEIPENKAKALTKVPLDDLQAIASAKYESSGGESGDKQNVIQDLLLLELLEWFKTEFFTWTNSPDCPACGTVTVFVENSSPTELEALHSADRVEVFRCPKEGCGRRVRFPRFNNPAVLLDSRTGRCGEWANCFGLICRAIGYETRYVFDFTDHVWVEVFSAGMKPKNRWLHCDPCENKCDNPLLYEAGWGKKLTFVIAASIDDVQDVTWRYTHSKNLKEVLSRRNCNERRIAEILVRSRKLIQSHLPETRRTLLQQRLVEELAEFICPTGMVKESELQGRESGSLAWRLARQEIKDEPVIAHQYEWEVVHPSEDAPRQFVLAYDPVSDIYVSNLSPQTLKGWEKGVFKAENVSRKEERDWKMVYLARQGEKVLESM